MKARSMKATSTAKKRSTTRKGKIANTDTDTDVITAGFSFHFDDKGSYAGFAVNNLNNKYGIPPGAHEHGHEEEHGET